VTMGPRRWQVIAAAVCIALFTLAWRFLMFAGFNNDHHVNLARAQEMLLGECRTGTLSIRGCL